MSRYRIENKKIIISLHKCPFNSIQPPSLEEKKLMKMIVKQAPIIHYLHETDLLKLILKTGIRIKLNTIAYV